VSERPGLLKSAGIISAAVAFSRVTGMLRESVLSALFGAGATFDAYVLGYRIPNLARDLFAEGALASAFVPTFSRYLATGTPEETRELSDVMGTVVIVVTGSICLLGIIFSPVFVEIFASGFHAVPGKFELAVQLVRIMFPFLLLIALSAQAQGILNASHRFGIPALSSTLFNIGSVLFGLAVGHFTSLGAVQGMAVGVVFGGLAQLCFQLPSVWKLGFAWRPRWNLRHEGIRHILKLMGPAILAGASVQINSLVNTNFAAGLRDASGHVMNGPVSWLSYAYRFQQLPLGIFGIALASATLPRIARSAALGRMDEFRDALSHSISMILLTTVPSSVGLAILGESMIGIVYQHGRFLASDTHQTAIALTCYAIGLGAVSSLKLISPAFYALGDSRTPMYVSLGSIAVNAAVAFTTVRFLHMGHAGLALSSSSISIFSSLSLLFLISPRIGGIHAAAILASLFKILVAAAVMGAACLAVVHFTHARALNVLLGVPVSAAVFYAVAALLRVPELADVQAAVLRKFGVC
jgi:putative peptidoglycan lipid II flippase